MQVWIDQDLCTGCGLCEEIAPLVFTLDFDGLAHARQPNGMICSGSEELATVPPDQRTAVIEAAEECPGEIIQIEDGSKY